MVRGGLAARLGGQNQHSYQEGIHFLILLLSLMSHVGPAIYTRIVIDINIYVYIYTYIYVYIHVRIYTYIYIRTYTYIYMYVHMYAYFTGYLFMGMCIVAHVPTLYIIKDCKSSTARHLRSALMRGTL